MNNPLQNYFRTAKLSTKLPSNGNWYSSDVIELNESGELDILPMTASDEVTLKNPDQLLSGEAITKVITSCVPGVKNPKKLLSNDTDILLTAIRCASMGDTIDINSKCPKCEHENSYELNLRTELDIMNVLDSEYIVENRDGLSIYLRPMDHNDNMKALKIQFEQNKMIKSIGKDASEEKILQVVNQTYNSVMTTNIDLISSCIAKISTPSGDSVTDRSHILEFINNIDSKTFRMIKETMENISKIGLVPTKVVQCKECDHEWEADISLNPVDFFTES